VFLRITLCARSAALRTEEGEQMVLDDNFFVEQRFPAEVLRTLSTEERATYRAPFKTREDRLPTLVLPCDIPVDGEPAEVAAIVDAYGAWLAQSKAPKLLILAEGGVLTGRGLAFARTWPNQKETTVKARHYMQEDVPHEIGRAIADFVRSLASAQSDDDDPRRD
jgi:haloalkane dehalogenase